MDKYDTLTDGELRELMARREGWTFVTKEAGRTFDGTPVIEWIAIAPGGKRCHSLTAIATTQKAALERYTPNWPQNAADALALPAPDGAGLWRRGERWEASFDHWLSSKHVWYAEHSNPARAWSIAWLRWQDAQEDK